MNTLDVEVYVTGQPLPIPTPFQAMFGGAMLAIQTGNMVPIFLTILVLIVVLILVQRQLPSRLWQCASLGLISLLSVLMSAKVSQGWDELFMNLRHSYVLRETGHFSYNMRNAAEGTVDFLPFFLVGWLGRLSLPLEESIIVVMLSGNVMVIVASWRMSLRLTQQPVASMFFALGIGVFPCVLSVGATGFGAVLFSALIVLSIYLLLFAEPRAERLGLAVLSMLTLIRVEGVAFAMMLWAYVYLIQPAKQLSDARSRPAQLWKALVRGLVVVAPFVLSALLRTMVFGYPLPNPVTFKNTSMSPPYLSVGIEQLVVLVHIFRLDLMCVLALVPFIYCYRHKLLDLRVPAALIITALFCLVYFTGGGDWFPLTWNRYMMPITVLAVLCFWCVSQMFFLRLLPDRIVVPYVVPAALVASVFFFPGGAFSLLRRDLTTSSNRWQRIDALGLFGRFLEATTPEQTLIASPEMATTMYFARRDVLDLSGIASPEVAHAALDPISPGELGHRRRQPRVIDAHLPGIVGFWDMSRLESLDVASMSDSEIKKEIIQRFLNYQFYEGFTPLLLSRMDIAYYRGGSMEHLKDLGYRYLIVSTPESVFYYLVHDSIYDAHRKIFAEKYRVRFLGNEQLPYLIDPGIRSRFPSGG